MKGNTVKRLIATTALLLCASWSASAQERDEAGRYIIDGMGGGTIRWGYNTVNQHIMRGEPLRLSGRFTSAGTFMLYAVEQLPGSCIEPDSFFDFHEPQSLAAALFFCAPFQEGPRRDEAIDLIVQPYNEPLTEWFMRVVVGDRPSCSYTTLRGSDMAQFGYPICAE